jgi:hypothetical protein
MHRVAPRVLCVARVQFYGKIYYYKNGGPGGGRNSYTVDHDHILLTGALVSHDRIGEEYVFSR